MKKFRDQGAAGALLDEYEKAILELIDTLKDISSQELHAIVDSETQDKDCKSIQTILSHVVNSGYNYVVVIRKSLGENIAYVVPALQERCQAYSTDLVAMFQFNVQLFLDYPHLKLEEHAAAAKIKVRWGQIYDVEQLLEHAILHVLRHRRQIERFLVRLRN